MNQEEWGLFILNETCLPTMTDMPAEPAELPDIISYITLQENVQHKEVHMSTIWYIVQ